MFLHISAFLHILLWQSGYDFQTLRRPGQNDMVPKDIIHFLTKGDPSKGYQTLKTKKSRGSEAVYIYLPVVPRSTRLTHSLLKIWS